MYEVDCFKRCCHARYCPLVTAWATTVHKFQGFEAGFDKSDTVAHIIADIGPLTWERLNPGTAYVVSSRAKTIGDHSESNPCPYNSNLFFSGAIGPHRFTECNIKKDGNPCILVEKRDAWVKHLMTKADTTNENTTIENRKESYNFITNTLNKAPIQDIKELHTRIVDILKNPSRSWKSRREQYILKK